MIYQVKLFICQKFIKSLQLCQSIMDTENIPGGFHVPK